MTTEEPAPGTVSSNLPLRRGKGTIYEGGVRVCAFASWPGHIPAGKRNAEPVHIIDWYPTLVTLAGGSLKQELPIDGRDIWPVLTEGAKSPHEALLLPGLASYQAAIRQGDWKLLMNAGEKCDKKDSSPRGEETFELYNLATDWGETKNVLAEQPAVAKELQALLKKRLATAIPLGGRLKAKPGGQ